MDENMFSTTNYQANVNPNQNDVSPHMAKNGFGHKHQRQQLQKK